MTPITPWDSCSVSSAGRPLPGGRPIRVVQVLATGSNGGAQEHLVNLLTRLDPARYDVSVVSLTPGSTTRRLARLGVSTLVIDEADDAIAVGAVATHLADVRADVVHNHMYRAEIVGTRAAIALGEVGHPRPYIVSTVHSSRIRAAEDRALLRTLTPRIDQLIAVSRAICRKLEDEGRTTAPVELIYNGIDLGRFGHLTACCTLHREFEIPVGVPLVGVVARLEPEKGHPTLLEAWPRVLAASPEARLLVIGEGSQREALEAQAAELGIASRVVFTGLREDIPAVTAALDIAVLPSYREAQGLSVLEAMALSRPVVASAVGGIPEMIEDGRTGLLVPSHDPAALGGAIGRLLADEALAAELGRAGHDLVHERFCVELMVDRVARIYETGAELLRVPRIAAAG
jgi:glycosyltransferase involved in cell wall biosynthesis